jgi:CRP-like cAMP-binding protein
MNNLKNYLSQFGNLSEEDFQLITENLQTSDLKRGDFFVQEHKICKKMGFINQGIMRVFVWENDQENTYYFLKENQFVVDLESFYNQKPAQKYIEAVTDCQLFTLSLEKLQYLCAQIPHFERLVHQITEQTLMSKLNHRSPLVTQDAKTRYEIFLQEQRDIALRVPLAYIASYLGITQQSLSRLRRELAQVAMN